MIEAVATGLAAFLSDAWGEAVRVQGLRVASAGARRHNLIFDALRGSGSLPLVATVVPSQAVQVIPVAAEAETLRLAATAGVPVPAVHAVCEDAGFAGGPFFVTARIEGDTIPRHVLRRVQAQPDLGALLARQCGEALARLHAADAGRAPLALDRPGSCPPAEHALLRLEPEFARLLEPSPAFALAFRWLARNPPPAPAHPSLLHGDFRNGNLVVGPEGLRAALDWEVAHVGDPMEDLAWLCVRMWRFGNDALEVGGFASRRTLRAGYEATGGKWAPESFHWWKLYGHLRWGVGLAAQAAAFLDGSVPSIVMAASGRRVAELEWDVLALLRRAYPER